jgi:hypothetical protein
VDYEFSGYSDIAVDAVESLPYLTAPARSLSQNDR